jgi:hypothetical protein
MKRDQYRRPALCGESPALQAVVREAAKLHFKLRHHSYS